MPVNPLRMCANLTADLRIQSRMCANLCKPVRECSRISCESAGPERECARMCANVRGSANVRECARMSRECARMCANVCECSRLPPRMSANVSRMCENAPANVRECSRICRECLRKHAVSADGVGHVSRNLDETRKPTPGFVERVIKKYLFEHGRQPFRY